MPADYVTSERASRIMEMYARGGPYRALFQWMARYERNPGQTKIEKLAHDLDLSLAEATKLARELERARLGDYVVGRRGKPSRIVWKFTLNSMAAAAVGTTTALAEAPGAADDNDDEDVEIAESTDRIYEFPIRPDRTICFALPRDLTEREAERLATFIRIIPNA